MAEPNHRKKRVLVADDPKINEESTRHKKHRAKHRPFDLCFHYYCSWFKKNMRYHKRYKRLDDALKAFEADYQKERQWRVTVEKEWYFTLVNNDTGEDLTHLLDNNGKRINA